MFKNKKKKIEVVNKPFKLGVEKTIELIYYSFNGLLQRGLNLVKVEAETDSYSGYCNLYCFDENNNKYLLASHHETKAPLSITAYDIFKRDFNKRVAENNKNKYYEEQRNAIKDGRNRVNNLLNNKW